MKPSKQKWIDLARAEERIRRKNNPCPNCGEPEAHYVRASLGEPGFYTCERRP